MSTPYEISIEEFESGSWVADLIAATSFDGSFPLGDGTTWTGTTVTERQDFSQFYTRVIGGAGKLAKAVKDKFYSGSVSLQTAVGDICTEAGESVGSVDPSVFVNNYQRLKGTAASALQALADEFSLLWWIDRTGLVNMAATRPTGADATGVRKSSDVDASILLVNPVSATVGAGYDTSDSNATMPLIRHIRWRRVRGTFSAQLYPIPFVFRQPKQTGYDKLRKASIDSDNGDGTVNVIVEQSYGVREVQLLSGVPGSKITVSGGDAVLLGYFGGDPQSPFCVAMGQDRNASKEVARKSDTTKSQSSDDSTFWAWFNAFQTALGVPVSEPGNGSPSAFQVALNAAFAAAPFPTSLTGQITNGSSRISLDD